MEETRLPDSSRAGAWDKGLTRRLRVLLHAVPLADLKKSESLVDPELRHYDPLALSMKVLDLVVEHMGLERDVNAGGPFLKSPDGTTDHLQKGTSGVDRVAEHAAALQAQLERTLPSDPANFLGAARAAFRSSGPERRPTFWECLEDLLHRRTKRHLLAG